MSTATLPRVDKFYELDESLDFEVSCEFEIHPTGAVGHAGPAWALIGATCPSCGARSQFFICGGAWATLGHPTWGVGCCNCEHVCPRDEAWRVIELVKP